MEFPSYYFHNGYRRIKRFIAWFPVLWRDEDWDEAYLFEIMQFKISRMRQEMEKNKRHVGYEKNVQDMKIAEELLKRIAFSNSSYSDFYYDLEERLESLDKQGKCTCPEERFTFEPYIHEFKDGTKRTFSKFVNLSCDFCKDSLGRWIEREENKKREDLDFLFLHLRKHVNKWWD